MAFSWVVSSVILLADRSIDGDTPRLRWILGSLQCILAHETGRNFRRSSKTPLTVLLRRQKRQAVCLPLGLCKGTVNESRKKTTQLTWHETLTTRTNGWRRAETFTSWRRHQMETFSTLLAICAGNSPVPGEFPTQRPVTRSFDVFFDLRLNKRLSKQPWGWWFGTLSSPLWRQCNVVDDLTWSRAKLGFWARRDKRI